jgi:hypothetical protein
MAQRAASEDGPRRVLRSISNTDDHDHGDNHRPESPPIQPATPRTARFSMLRWRHASDSQLSTKARIQAEQDIPPVPAMPSGISTTSRRGRPVVQPYIADYSAAPSIIMTAPTLDVADQRPTLQRTKSRKFHPFSRQKQAIGPTVVEPSPDRPSMDDRSTDGRRSMDRRRKLEHRKSRFGTFGRSKDPAEELRKLAGSRIGGVDGGGETLSMDQSRTGSSLALPIGRKSESSRSEGDPRPLTSFGAMPTTPEKPRMGQANSTFPWLSRRNKQRASLFPLPVRIPPPSEMSPTEPQTPRPSTSARSSGSPEPSSAHSSPQRRDPPYSSTNNGPHPFGIPHLNSSTALAAASISFAAPGGSLLRNNSVHSAQSSGSSPALLPPMAIKGRTRSSTLGSNSGRSDDAPPPTPPFANGTQRDSTSTAGRSSFSNLFHLSRLRHGSDPHSPKQGSPSHGGGTPALGSHSNSLHLNREHYSLPEREEGETAIQFLARADDTIPKDQIPSLLADNGDEFHVAVMRSYMRKFAFFGDPLDMALRKLLMEVDLPKEAQQIDRVLQGFADRYHECNPGIFTNSGTFDGYDFIFGANNLQEGHISSRFHYYSCTATPLIRTTKRRWPRVSM